MLINYKCPHCPEWHDLNSWESRDIRFFYDNVKRGHVPALQPFDREQWVKILEAELTRRNRYGR